MRRIYLILLLPLLCSCGNTKSPQTKVAPIESAAPSPQSAVVDETPCAGGFKIYNDEMVYNIFNINVFRSDTAQLKAVFKTQPHLKMITERSPEDNKDYIYSVFETPGVYLKFMHKEKKTYLIEGLIKSDEIKIYKDIAIGMQKRDFCRILGIKETLCDTILVIDQDQTEPLYFTFQQNRLKELRIVDTL